MQINFYDEVRKIIKEELNVTDETLRLMIQKQIDETIRSVVNRAAQKVFADEKQYDLEGLIRHRVNEALSSYIGRDTIRDVIKKELPHSISVNVVLSENNGGKNENASM